MALATQRILSSLTNTKSKPAYVSGQIDGGLGQDALHYLNRTTDVYVDFAAGQATGTGSVRFVENVKGGSGDDVLLGDSNANVLGGMGGNDILAGRGGDDTLIGWGGRVSGPELIYHMLIESPIFCQALD